MGERHLGHGQRLQHASQTAQFLVVDACPSAPRVEQPPIRGVVAQQQGADVRSAALRIGPAYDDELLAVKALGLDPNPAVTGRIRLIRALGDGAFEPELAGLSAEPRAVAGNMLAVAEATRSEQVVLGAMMRFSQSANSSQLLVNWQASR